jgi:hypothetical protein
VAIAVQQVVAHAEPVPVTQNLPLFSVEESSGERASRVVGGPARGMFKAATSRSIRPTGFRRPGAFT